MAAAFRQSCVPHQELKIKEVNVKRTLLKLVRSFKLKKLGNIKSIFYFFLFFLDLYLLLKLYRTTGLFGQKNLKKILICGLFTNTQKSRVWVGILFWPATFQCETTTNLRKILLKDVQKTALKTMCTTTYRWRRAASHGGLKSEKN